MNLKLLFKKISITKYLLQCQYRQETYVRLLSNKMLQRNVVELSSVCIHYIRPRANLYFYSCTIYQLNRMARYYVFWGQKAIFWWESPRTKTSKQIVFHYQIHEHKKYVEKEKRRFCEGSLLYQQNKEGSKK